MNHDFLAYLRIFEYLLVIMLSLGLLRRSPRSYIFVGNVMMAGFLMMNAINYILGMPNAYSYQLIITVIVGIWAVTHLLEFLRS